MNIMLLVSMNKKEISNWLIKVNFCFSHMSLNDYLIDLNDACFLSAAKEKDYMAAYTQSVSSIPLNQGVYLYGNPGNWKVLFNEGNL